MRSKPLVQEKIFFVLFSSLKKGQEKPIEVNHVITIFDNENLIKTGQ